MKLIKVIVLFIFITIVFVPLLLLNTKPKVNSEIDNRMLAENPFSDEVRKREGADLTVDIENYLKDRIGFRDEIILMNTVLNDSIFNKMEHPTYAYGKDGYVFFNYSQPVVFGDFHLTFADMVKNVQDYCTERGVPFVFVFNPEKKSVYTEFLKDGVNFNNDWIDTFLGELDKRGVNYVNNTEVLIDKKNDGEQVFNRKYNAGHWNDLGAFYGVNSILENMQQFFPGVRLNKMDDFVINSTLRESLQVSQFPICDYEPVFSYKGSYDTITSTYEPETKRDPRYQGFMYTVNDDKKASGSPKTLVFQGSYMNGMGYKFLASSLGEYIAVHDYQNILNFPYYFNLYKPECVVFEVAEYTFTTGYFDYETMKNISWNPTISHYTESKQIADTQKLAADKISIDKGNVFSTIQWCADDAYDYVWLYADQEFDMVLSDPENNIYQVTVPNDVLKKNAGEIFIVGGDGTTVNPFQITGI